MSRSGSKKQDTVFNQAQNVSSLAGQQANSLFQTLDPIYRSEAVDPANSSLFGELNTAGQQSTGGATAAVKGQAGLTRLRSGNRGGQQTLLDESVRNAMRQNSSNALKSVLGVSEEGMQGLNNLYGANMNQQLQALGLGGNIANNQASQPGWFQNMTGLINSLSGAGAKGITL